MKEWLEWFRWKNVRMRIRIDIDKGKLVDFAAQLEIDEEDWKPVVRYNYAHGKPHRDLMHKDGTKEKLWIHRGLKEVLDYAKKDIKKNWKKYITDCGYDVETD